MSIQAADALMGIFGFKRVADDEKPLDNTQPLDDDGGSLNEGMEMEEATNIPSSIDCWACGTYMTIDEHSENDGYCPECNAEIDLDPYLAKAIAVIAARDARIAELEAESAEWSPVMQRLGDENQQLRAELAAAKETIMCYETTAENCDLLRAELAAMQAQAVDPLEWSRKHGIEEY